MKITRKHTVDQVVGYNCDLCKMDFGDTPCSLGRFTPADGIPGVGNWWDTVDLCDNCVSRTFTWIESQGGRVVRD